MVAAITIDAFDIAMEASKEERHLDRCHLSIDNEVPSKHATITVILK
jgi:hypothetical protein